LDALNRERVTTTRSARALSPQRQYIVTAGLFGGQFLVTNQFISVWAAQIRPYSDLIYWARNVLRRNWCEFHKRARDVLALNIRVGNICVGSI
jgi:hypothetical protein